MTVAGDVQRHVLATADVAQAVPHDVGALTGVVAAWPGARAVGPAYPCACTPGDNLALHLALARAPAGSVVVCDAGGDVSCAYAGELVALDARARGLAGLVVDGAVRDRAQLRELRFPVFATGACPLSPAKAHAGTVGEAVSAGGIPVRPGDLIVADDDGVLVVAGLEPDAVAEAVAAVRSREDGIRAALERGERLDARLGISPRA